MEILRENHPDELLAIRDEITRHNYIAPALTNVGEFFTQRFDRVLSTEIDLGVGKGPFGDTMGVKLRPGTGPGHTISLAREEDIFHTTELNSKNMHSFHHNIGIEIENYKIQVLEHLLGALEGLNIVDVDIVLDVSKLRKLRLEDSFWGSLPAYSLDLADRLLENSIEADKQRDTHTFDQRYHISFGGESYMVLIPSKDDSLVLDLRIDYSSPGIGPQRVVFDASDTRTFKDCILPARTGAHNIDVRKYYMKYGDNGVSRAIIGNIPILRTFLPSYLPKSLYVVHDDQGIYDSDPGYVDQQGNDLEVISHELLDAFGGRFTSRRLAGTIMSYKTSHKNDLQMRESVEQGEIKLIRV